MIFLHIVKEKYKRNKWVDNSSITDVRCCLRQLLHMSKCEHHTTLWRLIELLCKMLKGSFETLNRQGHQTWGKGHSSCRNQWIMASAFIIFLVYQLTSLSSLRCWPCWWEVMLDLSTSLRWLSSHEHRETLLLFIIHWLFSWLSLGSENIW